MTPNTYPSFPTDASAMNSKYGHTLGSLKAIQRDNTIHCLIAFPQAYDG